MIGSTILYLKTKLSKLQSRKWIEDLPPLFEESGAQVGRGLQAATKPQASEVQVDE
ncbi:hypothetical protein HPP92_005030 [Vanilla planifolia]|uniref:Uncharacterized protein n=1 Tax=Vanilla planifolia TaxID=51239 RepID=A0A835VAL3_VANPL|nr:hypothetical protein HPP92_005030 [Vanilla planifolia]